MPLLQEHMAGQEPEERVQEGTCPASPWPAETVGCDLGVSRVSTSLLRYRLMSRDGAHGVFLDEDEPQITKNYRVTLRAPGTQRTLLDVC